MVRSVVWTIRSSFHTHHSHIRTSAARNYITHHTSTFGGVDHTQFFPHTPLSYTYPFAARNYFLRSLTHHSGTFGNMDYSNCPHTTIIYATTLWIEFNLTCSVFNQVFWYPTTGTRLLVMPLLLVITQFSWTHLDPAFLASVVQRAFSTTDSFASHVESTLLIWKTSHHDV